MDTTVGHSTTHFDQSSAESMLKPLLDAFTRQEYSPQELTTGLTDICARQSSATWQALSLLDQYHRRRVLPSALFYEIKKELYAIAFGDAGAHVSADGQTLARSATARIARTSRTQPILNTVSFDYGQTLAPAVTASDIQSAPPPPSEYAAFQLDAAEEIGVGAEEQFHDYSAPPRDLTLPRALQNQPVQIERADLIRAAVQRPGTQLIGRYILIEPVVTGNVCTVFRALDQQRMSLPETERYVAIKCIQQNLQTDPRAAAAFRHEYEISQALSHPNIAKVYDFHEEEGASFIVMELLQGESLDRILERVTPRRLPTNRALAIVREIGFALAHAHDRGIVHGNLQTGSVTLMRDGELRLADFGQAQSWQAPGEEAAEIADDLYDLAYIAHELLCGYRPDSLAINRPGPERPHYAKHLSAQQWRAVQRGLTDNRMQRATKVRDWMADLDLRTAEIRLPELRIVATEVASEPNAKRRIPITAAVTAGVALLLLAGLAILWQLRAKAPAASEQRSPPAPIANSTNANDVDLAKPVASAPPAPNPIVATSDTNSVASDEDTLEHWSPANLSVAGLPTVSFAASRYEIPEHQSTARLVIRRSGPSDRDLNLLDNNLHLG